VKQSIITVPVRKIENGSEAREQDWLAVEEPLEIRLGGRNIAITMRTPGHDLDLAAGFLFTEGILRDPDEISSSTQSGNRIDITLSSESTVDFDRFTRHFYLSSSCGVCGKASIDALESAGCPILERGRPRVDRKVIERLPEVLRSGQAAFERTGGLHAAGLFDVSGNLLDLREDVGRHNAVDKLIGRAFLNRSAPLSDHILALSGRASFELIQKALMAGIAVVAAVGAPSSLAVELALRRGITLAGFVRNGRFNVYSVPERIL
jgi:FdhD protein